jgi:F-type H+-transporting ATPase subunit b
MRNTRSPYVKSRSRLALFTFSFFTFHLLLFTAVAFAQEGGEEQVSLFKAYLWPVINFAALVVLLVYMMKKMDVKGYFKKRTELIEQTLKEAREAKELAQKALAEVEERLRIKDKEIEEIVAAARLSGDKENERLVEEGNKLKDRILEQTKSNIDYEVKRAKEAIKSEAAEAALGLAEKKLKEKLTKEEQLKLLEESIAKIEGKN